ncbi:MAG: hypothetical protein GWP19_14180 [Planctomycetia bacterium]|nr:hypothetical protein [Planctomycetia bacterium]
MLKENINEKLREYVKTSINPTSDERSFVSDIYNSFKPVLDNNCLQIGSFPRYTAIHPIHDLDILYILGNWTEKKMQSIDILTELKNKIDEEYYNPTNFELNISVQSHSVTIIYKGNGEEIFSVDIVPAYIYSTNNYDEDTYMVPEVLGYKHGIERSNYYELLKEQYQKMKWINSDPRGYIQLARRLDLATIDFRNTVKFIKGWKTSCKRKNDNFKLKSFHIEQIIVEYLIKKSRLLIFDLIFKFFVELPHLLEEPSIKDRADNSKFIDDYIRNLTDEQKLLIKQARDCFLIKLENITPYSSIDEIINGCFYERVSDGEEFLFDYKIPVLIDKNVAFRIDGFVQKKVGFSSGWLRKTPQLQKGLTKSADRKRYLDFQIISDTSDAEYHKWKVKNDNRCERHQRRGELTDYHTRNTPETTAFSGNHFVECFAIKYDTCIAKHKCNVKIL